MSQGFNLCIEVVHRQEERVLSLNLEVGIYLLQDWFFKSTYGHITRSSLGTKLDIKKAVYNCLQEHLKEFSYYGSIKIKHIDGGQDWLDFLRPLLTKSGKLSPYQTSQTG